MATTSLLGNYEYPISSTTTHASPPPILQPRQRSTKRVKVLEAPLVYKFLALIDFIRPFLKVLLVGLPVTKSLLLYSYPKIMAMLPQETIQWRLREASPRSRSSSRESVEGVASYSVDETSPIPSEYPYSRRRCLPRVVGISVATAVGVVT